MPFLHCRVSGTSFKKSRLISFGVKLVFSRKTAIEFLGTEMTSDPSNYDRQYPSYGSYSLFQSGVICVLKNSIGYSFVFSINISALCHGEHPLENQSLKRSAFTLQNVYFKFHNLKTSNAKPAICQNSQTLGTYSHTDLSTKNKASIVSGEFYGLPAEFYGPQRFIELGIKKQ